MPPQCSQQPAARSLFPHLRPRPGKAIQQDALLAGRAPGVQPRVQHVQNETVRQQRAAVHHLRHLWTTRALPMCEHRLEVRDSQGATQILRKAHARHATGPLTHAVAALLAQQIIVLLRAAAGRKRQGLGRLLCGEGAEQWGRWWP